VSQVDDLHRSHQRELSNLKRPRRGVVKIFIGLFIALLCLVGVAVSVHKDATEWQRFLTFRRQIIASGVPWVRNFVDRQEAYDDWLGRYGTGIEQRFFNEVSAVLLRSAASVGLNVGERSASSFLASLYVSLNFGLLRCIFVVLACWRLWLVVGLVAWWYGRGALRSHRERDILGITSNHHPFFSGARVTLGDLGSSGAPQLHVTGLACPPTTSISEARGSSLGKILSQYGAESDTTLALAAIILKSGHIPAYVALPDDEQLLQKAFEGSRLSDNAERLLSRALALHKEYVTDPALCAVNTTGAAPSPSCLKDSDHLAVQSGLINREEYPKLMQRAMHRVLQPAMRSDLIALPAAQIAMLVLAIEAGKVLAYRQESGHWVRRSSFVHLSARAVLHSIAAFGTEITVEERTVIRRALIYASRASAFATVRFPVDFTGPTRALRQWSELLVALPHQLQYAADEVEMFGIVSEVHERWSQEFVEAVSVSRGDLVEGCLATASNLIFIPVARLVASFKSIVSPYTMRRLEELAFLVSQRQRLISMASELSSDGDSIRPALSSNDRVFTPLSHQTIELLAAQHGVEQSLIREWSVLRVVLNSFSWLGRRVGDYTVPESSIIFTVFSFSKTNLPPTKGVNALGLFGYTGMVPLRATRIEAHLGRGWRSRFTTADNAVMAESRDTYTKLLKGLIREPVETLENAEQVGVGVGVG